MDRTAGHPGWMVVKPFVTQTSNCILPDDVVNEMLARPWRRSRSAALCLFVATTVYRFLQSDPVTAIDDPIPASIRLPVRRAIHRQYYAGFDPTTAPEQWRRLRQELGGNQLPNAPHFTTSLSADYTMPVSEDWAATLHGDFYWQSQSFARIFNDRPYDKLRGYSTINLALIFTNADGWQVMGYVKNVFDATAITGAFLNSDDTALTTNIFTTDPRLYGMRITKNF